ncbi:MAG: AAA family ATPase [Proteobacteria bacterium]|nr:AAA family ATPase [Pseudomonadota bacterium]
MMVFLSDGEESDEERALIADYLTTLSNHAASSYTPDRIELIEPDPPLPEPTNRGEAPPPISSLLIAQALQAQLNQLPALASKLAADQPNSPPPSKKRPLEELLAQLDQLIGLNKVKQDVRSLINLVKINKLREDRGMPTSQLTLHLVFSGNPGTGKTTVARLLAEIYQSIGILKQGHLVETDRAGLVAGFVGQTALKVREAVTQAIGGVLFIDEAYSLCQGGMQDYGQEAIDTLIKLMEDNRKQLIVIIAGYPDRMQEFLLSNPGMESRFNKFILFEDYQPEELYAIFMKFCTDTGYTYDENCAQLIADHLAWCWQQREANFANARTVRNFYETVVANQANRIAALSNPTETDLATLSPEDLPKAA